MLQLNFTPFPILETERLILRAVTPEDAEEMFIQRTDKEITRYILRKKTDASPADTLEVIKRITKQVEDNEAICWIIMLKGEARPTGTISFWNIWKENDRAELGYILHKDFWKKGIMNEAVGAVLRYGFEQMQLKTVEASTHHENIPSRKLLERFGFKLVPAEPGVAVMYTLTRPATFPQP